MSWKNPSLAENPRSHSKLLELDPSAIAQTKAHIGTLVAEIAELAKRCDAPQAFYAAMLSRLVTAMAATGGGVWQRSPSGTWQLVQSYRLPESLIFEAEPEGQSNRDQLAAAIDDIEQLIDRELETPNPPKRFRIEPSHTVLTDSIAFRSAVVRQPSPEHRLLLERVANEQQPLLIPPGDIGSNADRPNNPLQQCLIYSPIPAEFDGGALWLQVVQPPSGGIATQRGFLRFVAQIADLTADFLKTFRLRQYQQEQRLFQHSQRLLRQLSTPGDAADKLELLVEQLRELLGADQFLLLQRADSHSGWRIESASGLRDLDRRSEGEKCVADLAMWLIPQCSTEQPKLTQAIDHPSTPTESSHAAPIERLPFDRFMTMFSAAEVAWLPLFGGTAERPSGIAAIAYWSYLNRPSSGESLEQLVERGQSLGRIGLTALLPASLKRSIIKVNPKQNQWKGRLLQGLGSRWSRVILSAIAIAAIAVVPVPLRVNAPAVLHPSLQFRHYAPLDARIVQVAVDYGEQVKAGQLMLELEDRHLSNLLDDAISQQLKSKERRRDIESRLLRGDRLASEIRVELEGELETLRALADLELQRVHQLRQQVELLKIRASHDGVVATWNAKQLLQNRPVRAGQLLLMIHQPDGPWYAEARIRQQDAGKFLEVTRRGLVTAHLALTSHPHQRLPAVYQPSDIPMNLSSNHPSSDEATMAVRFSVPVAELPHRNAGSSGVVSVDIGRGPLVWSVVGDAVVSLWAKVRLWI